ncbi:MAG TPA: hypothetical protein DEQ14_08285 [Treponema sp.]|nr:hypothetical protein [Treponema sp.]
MLVNTIMPILGPIVLCANITIIFLCMRPKHGVIFTVAVLAVFAVAVHFLTTLIVQSLTPSLVRFTGVLFAPVMLLLFKGRTFHKLFVFFMPYQLGALLTHIADALVGATIGYQNPHAVTMYLVLSLVLLGVYMLFVGLFGRRLFDRMFEESRNGAWALYSLGAMFSFVLALTLDWQTVGAGMYFGLILFILWSIGILFYTIINTNEKAAQTHNAEALLLQMNAMREQTDTEKKYRDDMMILHHDVSHEMGIIMELFRTGKAPEAENVYAGWQKSLSESAPEIICAEPVLNAVFSRFKRRAEEHNIRLYINSNIPGAIPIDTIKFSVMVSNALQNALAATDKVPEQDKRTIRVKLLQSGTQTGLEITNPVSAPVTFDGRGLPVTHNSGHGIGTRSIAAFAKDNGYLLDFSYLEGKFTMRLVMGTND